MTILGARYGNSCELHPALFYSVGIFDLRRMQGRPAPRTTRAPATATASSLAPSRRGALRCRPRIHLAVIQQPQPAPGTNEQRLIADAEQPDAIPARACIERLLRLLGSELAALVRMALRHRPTPHAPARHST